MDSERESGEESMWMVMERLEKALEHKASSVANRVTITATTLKVVRVLDLVLGACVAT